MDQVILEHEYPKYKAMESAGTAKPNSHLFDVGLGYVIDMKEMVEYHSMDATIPKR